MLNFGVDDLAGVRERLQAAGAEVDPKIDEGELGGFGWALDPEGNRFELWQPPLTAGRETQRASIRP